MREPGPLSSMDARGPPSLITGVSSACAGIRSLANSAKSEIAMMTTFFIAALQSLDLQKELP